MKLHKLSKSTDQLHKVAGKLGVHSWVDPDYIPKPYGLRTKKYESLIKRMKTHQKRTLEIIHQAQDDFMRRNY